jgi:hypothetical protein
MDTLTNYITERIIIAERIRIDNVKQVKFPIEGSLDDIAEFLEIVGFKKIKNTPENIHETVNFFNNQRPGAYFDFVYDDGIDNKATGIEFVDRTEGEISNRNMLYHIGTYENELYFSGFFKRGNEILCKEFEKDEFLEAINKQFGF